MDFWVTPAQWKVLRRYWATGRPITEQDLVQEGLVRHRLTARLCLKIMECKHQIIRFHNGEPYIATTDSQAEWEELKILNRSGMMLSSYHSYTAGMNRYEEKEWCKNALETIEAEKAKISARREQSGKGR